MEKNRTKRVVCHFFLKLSQLTRIFRAKNALKEELTIDQNPARS
jgi:hypothetical protein